MTNINEMILPVNIGTDEEGNEIIIDFHPNTGAILVGESGTGKTTQVLNMVKSIINYNSKAELFLLVTNNTSDYTTLLLNSDVSGNLASDLVNFLSVLDELDSKLELRKELLDKHDSEIWRHFVLKQNMTGNVIDITWPIVVIDSLDTLLSQMEKLLSEEDFDKYSSIITKLIQEGRSRGIKVISVMSNNRVSRTHKISFDNSSMRLIFKEKEVGQFLLSNIYDSDKLINNSK